VCVYVCVCVCARVCVLPVACLSVVGVQPVMCVCCGCAARGVCVFVVGRSISGLYSLRFFFMVSKKACVSVCAACAAQYTLMH